FPGHRVATHARGTLAHEQNAEARDLHPLALLQVLGDHADQVFQHFEPLLLAELMLLSECGGQNSGGDRLAGLRLGWSGCCHRQTPWGRAKCANPHSSRGFVQRRIAASGRTAGLTTESWGAARPNVPDRPVAARWAFVY